MKRAFWIGIVLELIALALRAAQRRGDRRLVGTFMGMPYDFRFPTPSVIRERLWNPEEQHLLTPHVFGWGWSVNLYEAGRRLGLLRQGRA